MSNTETSPLPPPRRIITYHTPDGKCTAIEDTVPLNTAHGVLSVAKMMVQTDVPAKPENITLYAEQTVPLNGVQPGKGLSAFFIDLKPGLPGRLHCSQTLDYVVVIQGEAELETTNGQKWIVKPGDFVSNAGNVHIWRNPTDKWTRMFAVFAASEPVRIADGKTINDLYSDVSVVPIE